MIKLFRNIRKNLLKEGNTTKYFKYAIGEIVLVVIGILIALQINNWNEARKDKLQMEVYVDSIKEDLAYDREELESSHTILKKQIVAGDQIIPIMESDNHTVIDSLEFIMSFNAMTTTTSLVQRDHTWDLLNSTGVVSQFEDAQLKQMLQSYYRDYQLIADGLNNSGNPARLEIRQLKYELFTDVEHRKFFPTSSPVAPNKQSYTAIFENDKVLPKCRFIASTARFFDPKVLSLIEKGKQIVNYSYNAQ
jgi:hypothetical protein